MMVVTVDTVDQGEDGERGPVVERQGLDVKALR